MYTSTIITRTHLHGSGPLNHETIDGLQIRNSHVAVDVVLRHHTLEHTVLAQM